MLFSAMFIMLMTITFLMFNNKNKINVALSFYYISVALIMITAVLYISKTSFYTVGFDIDYRFYKFMVKLKCPFDLVIWLFNIGIGLFMASNIIFIRMFSEIKWYLSALMVIPILLFVYCNAPSFSWKLYIYLNSPETLLGPAFKENITVFLGEFGHIVIMLYMLLPFAVMAVYAIRTKIRKNREQTLLFMGLLFSMDAYVYIYFIQGVFFKNLVSISGLIKFPDKPSELPSYSFSAMIILVVMAVIILINLRYKPFNNLTIVSKKESARLSKAVDKNFRMLLHIYKNSFVGIEKLTYMGGEYLKEDNTIKAAEIYNQIGGLCGESVEGISRVLDLLRDVEVDFSPFSLYGCIEEALHKTTIGENIIVTKQYNTANDIIAGDKEHITEVFVNLFMNAVEACSEREQCFIDVSSFSEYNLIVIEITDNGCGIDKKDIKKIFKPFYSTKKRSKCGGIGLSYAEKIVQQQHGGISVKSEKGKYTTFQLYFPTIGEKRLARKGLL